MSTVAELKKKFESAKKVTLTPEQHAAALRQKDRDQQEAVRIAKARAARYNMTLRSLELQNAAQVTQATRTEKVKRDETMKSFQQPGRRVSHMKKSSQAKVEASQSILASALSHERSPKVAMEVVQKVAVQVEETLKVGDASTAEDQARSKQEAEAEALAAAREEEALEEAKKAKELEAAAAKAAAEAAAASKAAEEANAKAAAAEAEKAAELKRKAEEEEAKAKIAAERAEAAAAAAAAVTQEPEETPEPAVDDGAKFEMKSLSAALDQGNDDAINKAIVTEFLQEHDPAKLPEVERLMAENKGSEGELMQELVDKYSDPAETEIKVTAEVIVKIEEGKTEAVDEGVDEDFVEKQRKDAERIKLEEEAKIAAMDDNEKKQYMEQLAAQAKHQEEKDKMLKSQLNVYGSSGATALLGGRGRGRGKGRPKSDRQPTEYIVSGSNEGGQWEVNT